MKLSSFKRDTVRIEQGEWIGDLPGMGDLQVKVRGLNNADFRLLQAKLIQAIPPKRRRRGFIHPDDMDRIMGRCLLETVLLDWKGITDEVGKEVPYIRELAEEILTSGNYPEIRVAIEQAALLVGEDQSDADEELAKNSPPSSNIG